MRRIAAPVALAAAILALPESAAPPHAMITAAQALLNTLPADLKQRLQFPFDSEERMNWHYVPRERKGLPLKAMTAPQRQVAMDLLRTGLS